MKYRKRLTSGKWEESAWHAAIAKAKPASQRARYLSPFEWVAMEAR
jgi:hypothetical protein